MRFVILGRSVGKGKKKTKIKLEKKSGASRPVPQHNIRGAWKQQGVVTKSTSRQRRKEKVDVVVKIKREQGRTKNL